MNIGIIGLGLIGGSLAKSIKNKTAHTVYAADTNHTKEPKLKFLNSLSLYSLTLVSLL